MTQSTLTTHAAAGQAATPATITVDRMRFPCDGGGDGLGHPRVYLTMAAAGKIECPYCGRHYALAAGAADHSH